MDSDPVARNSSRATCESCSQLRKGTRFGASASALLSYVCGGGSVIWAVWVVWASGGSVERMLQHMDEPRERESRKADGGG